MRTLEDAGAVWQDFSQLQSLDGLKQSVRLDGRTSTAVSGSRSTCWKVFLVFETLDVTSWQRTLASSRSAYNTLRSHFLRSIQNPDLAVGEVDPLTQDAETSPWTQMQNDEALRAEILQDVVRCMPENPFFRKPETQRMLLDILFIFCKLNPDVGYRQGMHEVAAPILWVVDNDAVDIGDGSKALGQEAVIRNIFDAEHIEHDAFTMFGQVMQSSKSFYISEGPTSIATRSHHIFNELLVHTDPELAKHLQTLDVLPQVFLIRWIRLIFGREFDFNDVLALWDVIFAEDPTLEIVDHICLTMLLKIRWDLLDADYNGALTLLLHYPELEKGFPAQRFALDALYLRSHLDTNGANQIVLKYSGRAMHRPDRPTTPPALQRNITTISGINVTGSTRRKSGLSPRRTPRQARNIETLLQDTAKNIYARSEKLGIGKAVRSAVDEVHKKAQEIRDAQTSSPPPWRRPYGSDQVQDRAKALELRNQKLSALLSGAVSELWDCQKLIADSSMSLEQLDQNDNIDRLSAAIAKVQFVQVYLDEPSLILADEEAIAEEKGQNAGDEPTRSHTALGALTEKSTAVKPTEVSDPFGYPTEAGQRGAERNLAISGLTDPSMFDDDLQSSDEAAQDLMEASVTGLHTEPETHTPTSLKVSAPEIQPTRPSLEHGSFSFMLGQDSRTSRSAVTPTPEHHGAKKSLFNAGTGGSPSRKPEAGKTLAGRTSHDENDDFDLGSLRRAKRTQ